MTRPVEALLKENEELQLRLEEAEAALLALKLGEADALLVGSGEERVFTLEAVDLPYRLLVEERPHAAATLTPEGVIIQGNRRFAALLDQPSSALSGKPLRDFVVPGSQAALADALRDAQEAEVQAELVLESGANRTTSVRLAINNVEIGALGTCLLLTDVTELWRFQKLQRTEQALHAASERLELAQRAGRIGIFEWHVATGAMSWSATATELYGRTPGRFCSHYEEWKRALHPDDRERVHAAAQSAARAGTPLDIEFRIVRPDGETRWIAAKGNLFRDGDGRPVHVLGVNLDVTERRRSEEALRAADRRKDEFLATLAHEMRNPLAPIRNAVEILKVEGCSKDAQELSRAILDRQVQHMTRLIEDLLDLSRISSNKLELRKELVDIRRVLEAALETSRPAIEAAGHELLLALPSEPLHLEADPVRLAQVFANLLINAAKFTEDAGRVWLRAERQGEEVKVSVQDSGIGIPADMLSSIFEIFSQAGSASGRSRDGLGIGLSLAKGLVELHGGNIEAASDGPGRGSEFVVSLPIRGSGARSALRPGEGEVALAASFRMLVVDDNQDSADSLAVLLQSLGHTTSTAYDGERALEKAEHERPDVVLLDIGMPKIDGYETCRRLRARPWGRSMCLIAVTGWSQEEDRNRAQEAGFDHHLVKPVDPAVLQRLLATSAKTGGRQQR